MFRYGVKTIAILAFICFSSSGIVNTEGHNGVVRTLSAKTNGLAVMDIGVGFSYAQDAGFVFDVSDENGSAQSGSYLTRQMSNSLNLAIGAASFIDFAVSLPIFYDKTDMRNEERDAGIGDVSISMKLLYPPPKKKRVFYMAYFFGGTIPTGNDNSGMFSRYTYNEYGDNNVNKGPFYTADCFTLKPMMVWTFDIGKAVPNFQFQIDVNLGGIFSIDSHKNNVVLANLAFEYAPVEILVIFVDFAGQSRWSNIEKAANLGSDPLMLSPGLKIKTPVGLYILLSGDFALFSREGEEKWNPDHNPLKNWQYTTYVAPKFGFQLALGWNGFLTAQDQDKDGIKDERDRCPKDAEDKDGFEDEDGCPDPDNDKDGIPDKKDKCPNKAEDKDGFEDEDGCPDLDNDGDGIPDLQDKCPRVAEDMDGIEDGDGCPEGDNDNDGIVDSLDKCMNEPEDVDGFEDEDGCPDPDNDKDGIPDLKDKCPNKPETLNGIEDEDGCPDKKAPKAEAKSDMPKHQIIYGVKFASGSVDMTYDSYQYLEPIIKEMKKFPDIEIEIRGHTDSVGRYESNMRLSERRAESVRRHMIQKGISSDRMRAVGFGPSNPVADNRIAAGRAKNRRIEIVRVK